MAVISSMLATITRFIGLALDILVSDGQARQVSVRRNEPSGYTNKFKLQVLFLILRKNNQLQ